MKNTNLDAQKRAELGSKVKNVREQGSIPAVFYGRGMPNIPLSVNAKEFTKLFKEAGESTIINLNIEGDGKAAIIYDVQYHPISGEPIHIDFYGVRMDEEITANIPIEFIGESIAVEELEGILTKTLTEIEVETLPGNLPHSFTVDISVLTDIDQSIHIKDIDIPDGVKVLADPDTVIVSVSAPREEEEEPIEDEAEAISEVKVEGEEDKGGEDEAGEEGGKAEDKESATEEEKE